MKTNLYKLFYERHVGKTCIAHLKDKTKVEGKLVAVNHAHFNIIINAYNINGKKNNSHICIRDTLNYLEIPRGTKE